MATTKCELNCTVTMMGEGKSLTSLVVLKFGGVVLGSARYGGRWDLAGVLRDMKTNGAKSPRWKLNDNGKVVLKSQGYSV